MSIKVGITGGIGSGKSLICEIFKVLGVPILNADDLAKKVMVENLNLKKDLIHFFGSEIYFENGELNRQHLASLVFTNEELLQKLNSLVHKVVIEESVLWANKQTTPYCLKEAALMFESGSYKLNDYNILVTAPVEIRIERVMKRDQTTREHVQNRINKQLLDEEKIKLADFLIENDSVLPILPQVLELHEKFLKLAKEKEG